MKKVYISGKISDLPIELAKQKFAAAAQLVEQLGHEAVSPFSNGLHDDAPWESHMVKDIEMLLGCDAIYMLPCWEDSKGARIEKHIAEVTNKAIYEMHADKSKGGLFITYFYKVVDLACDAYGVKQEAFFSKYRCLPLVHARMIVTHVLTLNGVHESRIAKLLNRDRTTVLHYLKKFENECRYPIFKSNVKHVLQSLNLTNN